MNAEQTKTLKPGDIVEVDRSVFAASPQMDNVWIRCEVRDVNAIGQVYVNRLDNHDGLYAHPNKVRMV